MNSYLEYVEQVTQWVPVMGPIRFNNCSGIASLPLPAIGPHRLNGDMEGEKLRMLNI